VVLNESYDCGFQVGDGAMMPRLIWRSVSSAKNRSTWLIQD